MSKDFLSIIIEKKQVELLKAKKLIPESVLRSEAFNVLDRRPFSEKFNGPGINIIAEIKRASPSKGPIDPDLDPAFLSRAYEKGGAVAISVLTEENFFMGSPQDLKLVRASTVLPVLRKDFIFSEYQLYESAIIGADAVLLIARCLSENQLNELVALSTELKIETLVEIHSEHDYEKAAKANARLIGINNRNLKTFQTDLEIATKLVGLFKEDQVPVAASGIRNRNDIEKNLKFGINNFLIGESLVKASDPAHLLQQLRGNKP